MLMNANEQVGTFKLAELSRKFNNVQESSITFKNVFERSKKEDVRERYSNINQYF